MKNQIFAMSAMFCLFVLGECYAEKVIWKGEVKSDGTPSQPIEITLNQSYQIKASGYVNLGKWVQRGEELATDACYEFSPETYTNRVESLKNSQNISVCDGNYHSDHNYQSKPFKASQSKMHFWISDTDYEDNNGALHVEVVQVEEKK